MKHKITVTDEQGELESAIYEQVGEHYGVLRELIALTVGRNLNFDTLPMTATIKIERLG